MGQYLLINRPRLLDREGILQAVRLDYHKSNLTVAFYLFEIVSIFEQILCNMESK